MKPILEYIRSPFATLMAITKLLAPIIPDKIYLSIIYRCKMGKWINWKQPKTFTEKIQWLKIYERKPEYVVMVDKYAVKEFVATKIGSKYVIPTLAIWNKPDDINLDLLPKQFVLKTTHGGGSGGVVICKDKKSFDMSNAIKRLNDSLKSDIYLNYREWPYKNVPRKIIAEKFIELPNKSDLTDYKIFCFNGTPRYIQVIQDRNTKETIDFFDCEWNHQEFFGLNPLPKPATHLIEKPSRLEEMLKIAKILSKGTKFLRVDLYNTEDSIYFGELTFYPASGIGVFTPSKYNYILGDLLKIGK